MADGRLRAYRISIVLLRTIAPTIARIRLNSGLLADQLERAAVSIPVNLSDGMRVEKERSDCWDDASRSAAEVRAYLDMAEALGHIDADSVDDTLVLLDEVSGLIRGLKG